MRARVEPGCFEMLSGVFEERRGVRRRSLMRMQQPVDVIDSEADAFHMECSDGTRQRLAFGDDPAEIRIAG